MTKRILVMGLPGSGKKYISGTAMLDRLWDYDLSIIC